MKYLLEIMKSWGPAGVFAISTVESMGIPNPGGTDFLLLFMAAVRPHEALLGALLAIAGSLLGSTFFFEVLRRSGEKWLERYASSERSMRFRAWFLRYGLITVFIPALLPIPFLPFKVFAACAAATGVRRSRFLLTLAAGRIPRYLALAYLGASLGDHAGTWLRAHTWQLTIVALVLTSGLAWLAQRANRATIEAGHMHGGAAS